MRKAFSLPLAAAVCLVAQPLVVAEDSWPQWRGAAQNGVASGKDFPTSWSEDSGISWNTDLEGNGGSTPVIGGSTAYLTAGVDGRNMLMAFDIGSGQLSWQVDLGQDVGAKHRKGSGSNPSAVVDGDRVFAYFRSGDLACVDTQGNVLWKTNLQDQYGEDTLWWDLGSSPTVTAGAVIVAAMQSEPSNSYLVALNKDSGDEIWKTDRMLGAPKEAAQSYITPLVVQVDGQEVIAVMGADHLTLHSADSGEELARLGGFNPTQHEFFRSISSPVAEGNIIVCPYARGDSLTAVRMDQLIAGKGEGAIAWSRDEIGIGSDVPTPAAVDGRVYVVGDKADGLIRCLDIETGKTLWETKLPKSRIGFSSSPLVADDHLYVTSENATTYVIGPLSESQPGVVSVNELADSDPFTVASPVPVNGHGLLQRTRHRLYRIGNE